MQTLLASAGKQSKALDADLADLSGSTRIRRDHVNDLGFVNQTHEDWTDHAPIRRYVVQKPDQFLFRSCVVSAQIRSDPLKSASKAFAFKDSSFTREQTCKPAH